MLTAANRRNDLDRASAPDRALSPPEVIRIVMRYQPHWSRELDRSLRELREIRDRSEPVGIAPGAVPGAGAFVPGSRTGTPGLRSGSGAERGPDGPGDPDAQKRTQRRDDPGASP